MSFGLYDGLTRYMGRKDATSRHVRNIIENEPQSAAIKFINRVLDYKGSSVTMYHTGMQSTYTCKVDNTDVGREVKIVDKTGRIETKFGSVCKKSHILTLNI